MKDLTNVKAIFDTATAIIDGKGHNGSTSNLGPALLVACFNSDFLTRKEAAKALGVQANQVGKLTAKGNDMSRKQEKALANAVIEKVKVVAPAIAG